MGSLKKILIANRGEIARRVIHACKELGIRTVAVYSDPDADSLPVQEADEAYPLEGIESRDTYLDAGKILNIAVKAGADGIHPGYGFLSENADFAEACEKSKIRFIGPPPKALRQLGSKVASKKLAQKVKVPVVPGFEGELPKGEELKKLAHKIGYPLLLKAAAGGGGKGMRVVHGPEELEGMAEGAEREALAFFKDKTLFLEKYFENPKHIEVQILGDRQGNRVHLFERECSVQRRHQKMIEESPSPSLTPKLRSQICEAALKIAKEADYSSAGTVEFLLDSQGNYYFLEVNTRLQVEHPITELTTGIDLVKAQIRIAGGEALPFQQKDIFQRGHAIECRLYAEDPENGFLPSEGVVGLLREPVRPGVRIDSALQEGKEILPFYDPMLAKLIVYDETRPQAIEKMVALLGDYVLLGLRHNLDFLRHSLRCSDFISGTYHTHSVSQWSPEYQKARAVLRKDLQELSSSLAPLCGASVGGPLSSSPIASSPKGLEGFRNA